MFKSVELSSEASKTRHIVPMKKYAAEGKNIPLMKNWSENWCTLPNICDNIMEEILNFEVRIDDVFVVTFMKSVTTWMEECAWLLLNNLDFKKAKEVDLVMRIPFIDIHGILPGLPNAVEFANNFLSPRLIKTHMPANLMPIQVWEKKQKIIYVARNAKDVIVSSYHFVKNMGMWFGNTFEEYVNDFLNNDIHYTHFWSHIVDFWRMRNEPFIFFVTYEEMKRDLAGVLQKLCTFLERPQLTADELEMAVNHLSFDSMKNNRKSNLTHFLKDLKASAVKDEFEFMRRGIVGSFKDELTPELQAKIDAWTQEFLAKYDLKEEDIFGKL